MVLTALGIDIMLPAFAAIRQHFHTTAGTETSKLVSFFFMGQVTQLIFGYLTDRFGRLPVLRAGVVLYIVSGFCTVYAPSLAWMFFFRFISGVGAAAVFMTSIASVRDRFSGDAMARVMSLVLFIFLFTPVVAPALGTWVLHHFSWQVVFLIPPSFAVIVLIWSFRIPESLPPAHRLRVGFGATLARLTLVLSNGSFMRYNAIATLLFAVFSIYIASAEHIISNLYHRPTWFPYIFGGIGLLLAASAFGNAYGARRFGAQRILRYQLLLYLIFALSFLIITLYWQDPPPLIPFLVIMSMLAGLTTAADPNSSALALQHTGEQAGLAAAIYGTLFFSVGSGIGAWISGQLTHSLLPMACAYAVIAVINVMLSWGDRRAGQPL